MMRASASLYLEYSKENDDCSSSDDDCNEYHTVHARKITYQVTVDVATASCSR